MPRELAWPLWEEEAEVLLEEGKAEPEAAPDVFLSELESSDVLSSLPSLRHRLLSAEEEIELGRRIERGDEEARRILIESNVRLVYSIAQRYRHTGVPLEDLIQEGFIGLIHAVDRFDYRRGCRFSTCASSWIRAYILQAVQNLKPLIHLPQRVALKVKKIWRAWEELLHEFHRPPTPEEVSHRSGLPLEQVEHLLSLAQGWISLEEPVGEEGDTLLGEMLEDSGAPTPEEVVLRKSLREQIEEDLQQLTPQEREVIRLRFGLDDGQEHTLEEIGRRFHLTRQRVKEIEKRALQKMRCLGCSHLGIELMKDSLGDNAHRSSSRKGSATKA